MVQWLGLGTFTMVARVRSIPGWGTKIPQAMKCEGNGNPLQSSCLENPMDSGAWKAIVPGIVKESDTT